MTHMHRLAAAVALTTGPALMPIVGSADIIEQILVNVNGEIFTKTDLETRQVAALRQRGLQFERGDLSDQQLRQALDSVHAAQGRS